MKTKTAEEIFEKANKFANERHIRPDKNDYDNIDKYEQDYGGWQFVSDEALECYQEGYKDGQKENGRIVIEPTNDEIKSNAIERYGKDCSQARDAFELGAKWMRDLIFKPQQ